MHSRHLQEDLRLLDDGADAQKHVGVLTIYKIVLI
jgi:hypothetical protein